MTLSDFLADLHSRDIRLRADGDRLRCSGPVGDLTPELRLALQQRKPEILEFLRSAETMAQQPPAIVPLQPRGTQIPVFAVPGHNGDVFAYRALAEQLGSDQPFFGLRPAGLDSHSEPFERVEDLAAYFVDQILSFRPGAPVIIAGYCAGGAIAFEVAQQLTRRGAPVSMIALFGCPHPAMFRFTTAKLLPGRVAARVRALVTISSVADGRRQLRAIAAPFRRAWASSTAAVVQTDELTARRTRLEHTTVSAVSRYSPVAFGGRVSVFLPNRRWVRTPAGPLRWRALARQSDVFIGPDACTPDTMLRPPFVEALAGFFRQSVERPASRPEQPADLAPARRRWEAGRRWATLLRL